MSSIEINKVVASVLLALIVAWASGLLASKLIEPKFPERVAATVPVTPGGASGGAATAPAAEKGPDPIGPLLAAASVDAGKTVAKKCVACHTFDKGGRNGVGPNLWSVVGDEVAHDRGGYSFSSALQKKGGEWTPDNLNEWLWRPQAFAKGTKMTFVGLPSAKERADIIAYLNSLSDSPKPLASP
ncbi:MAG TPA: cytochrome c family protein [Stellaceae bacterium]|nr:cytochrome c family protein [Stellaceae bacterium]